ncbi:alpha/beta hydrolase [Actinomadura logoneensis]|uniref:Alpha/beta hydrolase n=1 Tax=Actinomadura logoneensis TaxID=2293572 RepID=A0A372JQN2_9ACTN|nr:dienelactone hydrolase family protein [Actinomadura logoneensis]RFU42259.1 alpha/beta hydrolase [Actinomadura logoneensis]
MTEAAAEAAKVADGERVSFTSGGETIVGRLFAAAFGEGPAPAVAIIGPMTYVKEQSPVQYARRLAGNGYTALIFDPRYRGESGGEPRCLEDPVAKVEDLRAAVGYLAGRPEVDRGRLGVVGICMGGNTAVHAAADDPLIKVVAAVTPHFRNAAADAQWLGGAQAVAARLERGRQAKATYEATGRVEYVPGVHSQRTDVGMPGLAPWTWYQEQADRGVWENQHAVMSEVALLSYESLSAAARLTKPFLLVHGANCALPEQAERHFAVVPTPGPNRPNATSQSSPPPKNSICSPTHHTWRSTTTQWSWMPPPHALPTGSRVTLAPAKVTAGATRRRAFRVRNGTAESRSGQAGRHCAPTRSAKRNCTVAVNFTRELRAKDQQ